MHEPQQMCKNLNEFISEFLSIVKSRQIIFFSLSPSLLVRSFCCSFFFVCVCMCALFVVHQFASGFVMVCIVRNDERMRRKGNVSNKTQQNKEKPIWNYSKISASNPTHIIDIYRRLLLFFLRHLVLSHAKTRM